MTSVLLICYAAEPGRGSESGSGYNYARELAKLPYDLTLITRVNNAAVLRQDKAFDSVRIIGFDVPRAFAWWKSGSRGILLYYWLWMVGCARLAKSLDAEYHFDNVHQYNFHTDWAPHFLKFKSANVLWGPICHQPRVPASYFLDKRRRSVGQELLKFALKWLSWNVNPWLRLAIHRSTHIFFANEDVPRSFRISGKVHVENFGGAGWSEAESTLTPTAAPLRLLHVGRTVAIKGLVVALEAFNDARMKGADVELAIVGSGPMLPSVRQWVAKRQLDRVVHMYGQVDFSGMAHQYDKADALLYPSLGNQDTVVAEALASGLPVVCVRGSGAASMAGPSAVAVAGRSGRESVARFAAAISDLVSAKRSGRLLAMSKQAKTRSQQISWSGTVSRLSSYYTSADPHDAGR